MADIPEGAVANNEELIDVDICMQSLTGNQCNVCSIGEIDSCERVRVTSLAAEF